MPLFLIFRAKIAQKQLFMQFLASFEQIAAYQLLCMASKMDRMQLFIIFQGNNCTKTPIYAIVGLFLSKQLHMGSYAHLRKWIMFSVANKKSTSNFWRPTHRNLPESLYRSALKPSRLPAAHSDECFKALTAAG